MAKGRPQKPFQTSWGEVIPGLARDTDGRWRIAATGRRFTEPDERRAVARYRAQQPDTTVPVPATVGEGEVRNGILYLKAETPASSYWPWLREQLISQPEYVAKMTGIPELANLRHLPMPKPSIKIDDLIAVYQKDNPSTARTKRHAVATFRRLVRFAEGDVTRMEDASAR